MIKTIKNKPYNKVIVAGSTGFIGKTQVQKLRSLGVQVLALSRSNVDITDREAVRWSVNSFAPEVIFNLSAYGTFRGESDFGRMIQVNALGTLHLLDAAVESNCRCFVKFTNKSVEWSNKKICLIYT